jgi:hypothetical protein
MKRKYLIIVVVVVFIAVGLLVFSMNRSVPITLPPQIISPLPLRTPEHVYLPLVSRQEKPSKKCVALSTWLEIDKILEIGARCTYRYWPSAEDYDGIENAGMVVYYNDWITVTGSAPYFMGYNEPDLGRYGGGAPVTPAMAAEMWPRIIAANPGKLAVSPAPSHLHPEWLEQFYAAHVKRWGYPPKLDALAAHCYGGAEFCQRIVSQIIGYADRWNVPEVWVTEFAFTSAWQSQYPAGATWQSEAQRFIAWMDAEPRITRYYWWALIYDSHNPEEWWCNGWYTQLYDWATGELTERGRFYQAVH